MGIRKTVAHNLREYRKARGYTQESLAEASGLHRTYIGGIEQGRINVSINNIEKIARALEIDPLLLFVDDDPSASREVREKPARENGRFPAQGATELADMQLGDYALCSWTKEGIRFRPLDVKDDRLSVHILSSLIAQGYDGDDLVRQFQETQSKMIAYFRDTLL